MISDYTPIACSVYDELEAAAVQNISVEITFNGMRKILCIQDLRTKDQAEYLIGRDTETGEEVVLRLDLVDEYVNAQTKKPLGNTRCQAETRVRTNHQAKGVQ